MSEQLNRNAASQDLSNQSSQNQQFRQSGAETQSYNSEEQRQVYHSTQQSFNEQRAQYGEQAFNMPTPELPERDDVTAKSKIPYDRKLEKLTNKKEAAVNSANSLYDSLPEQKEHRIVSEKKLLRPHFYVGEEVTEKSERIDRLLKNKTATRNVLKNRMLPGGRLVMQKTRYRLSKKEYKKNERKEHRGKYIKDVKFHAIAKKGRLLFDDQNIAEDEDAAAMKRSLKKGVRNGRILIRESSRNIQKKTNKYARLKNASDKEKLLDEKINQRIDKLTYKQDRNAAKAAQSKAERKKRMQRARQQRKEREGNFLRRTRNHAKLRKKSVEQKAKKVKDIISVVFSVGMIIIVLLFALLFVFVFLMALFEGSTEAYVQTIVQVDYSVMSDCTAYYRQLEADLEEKLADKETLEQEIAEEFGDDIYEYVYNLADISYDSTTLVAYLGAKYVEFTLADVQAELEELFALNYKLVIETKMEFREINGVSTEVKICYITLEKTPLEEIVIGRLAEEKLYQYNTYKMSSCGQQVYGPVMETDWTSLITSNFGERIHPITGERTRHNGVDIGIPTGTPLYSAVEGTVEAAAYSDTAGHYVKVKNKNGWVVTFMHMDSIEVAAGDKLKKGDFVGYSGNTGRSTGPHLHLEVRDAENNPVNPIFIIPQNCALYEPSE